MEPKPELLDWNEDTGVGFYPANPNGVYGFEYWRKYQGYAATERGENLTRARIQLIDKYIGLDPLLDVGIGSGKLIDDRAATTWGYDVNVHGIKWLLDRNLWWDPYFRRPKNACCWDSIEHMNRPDFLIDRVISHLFVSIPIFRDKKHVLQSKHFRPDEHYWYFTREGFVNWMYQRYFSLLEANWMEEEWGREDIGTFVFKRRR